MYIYICIYIYIYIYIYICVCVCVCVRAHVLVCVIKYTLRICNTHYCSTATMVMRTRLNAILHVHRLSCFKYILLLVSIKIFYAFIISPRSCVSRPNVVFCSDIHTTYITRSADKSLARPGRNKLGIISVTRAISTTSRRELSSSFFFSLQGKAPKEIHAILTETIASFLPGRAKELSVPL